MIAAEDIMTLSEVFRSISWEQFLIEFTSKRIYVEVLRKYPVFSSIVFFWIGCNIGSFLNVCIYRLPLGMSLFYPKSHCPKCGHKLSFYENIPIFSYLFLNGSCKECEERISPRYLIVETLTGLIFTACYLKIYLLNLPILNLFLLFFVVSVVLSAAFTDCDLRVIPDTLTFPAMIVVPLFWFFHTWPSLHVFDTRAFLISLANMAGTLVLFSLFTIAGKMLFKKAAFGWGDVKYLTVVAGAFGWIPLLIILLCASLTAIVYMPVYWCFRPKRKRRGFAFAPFLSIYVILWCMSGEFILRLILLFYRHD